MPDVSMTLHDLIQGLSKYPLEERNTAEEDIVVPTPQQQSAERKRQLLRRAAELDLNVNRDTPRHELQRAVDNATGRVRRQDIDIDI